MTPTYAWRLAKASFKETLTHLLKRGSGRNEPTFNQFVDEDLEIARGARDKDLTLIMHEAGDPIDIIWRNLGGPRGIYVIRKMLFIVAGLAIIFFLSTPAAIYSSLKMTDSFKFLDFSKSS